MIVRWTKPAVDDPQHICDYTESLFGDAQARRAALLIHGAVDRLRDMPNRGRIGHKPGHVKSRSLVCHFSLFTECGTKPLKSPEFSTVRSNGRDR